MILVNEFVRREFSNRFDRKFKVSHQPSIVMIGIRIFRFIKSIIISLG